LTTRHETNADILDNDDISDISNNDGISDISDTDGIMSHGFFSEILLLFFG
jgi:hypothetical protein